MSEVGIAVVIPAFDARTTLPAALDSVLEQSRAPDEIVVVDDGSTDATADVAEAALSGSRVPYYVLRQENRGPSAARNAGWRHARQSWIKFLDADDVLAAGALETEARTAEAANADVALLYAPWQRQTFDGHSWHPAGPVLQADIPKGSPEELLRSESFIAMGSALFKRAWLDKVRGFDESCGMIEDVDLHLRLAFAGACFQRVPGSSPHFYYRVSDGSLSRRSNLDFNRAVARNAALAERYWRALDELDEARKQQIVQLYWQAAYGVAESPELYRSIAQRIRDLRPVHPRVESRALRALLALGGLRLTGLVLRWYRRARR